MSCVQSVSFVVLINAYASSFFRHGKGLRQGCPLSPLLFILVVEGLSRAIIWARENGQIKGIHVGGNIFITHLLFVDDILLFSGGSRRYLCRLNDILSFLSTTSGMIINDQKSTISIELRSGEYWLDCLNIWFLLWTCKTCLNILGSFLNLIIIITGIGHG